MDTPRLGNRQQVQIDYILTDNFLRHMVTDAGSNDNVDFKFDHRCVHASFQIEVTAPARSEETRERPTAET